MGVSPIQGGSHIRSFVFDLSELTLAWGEGIWGASHPVISGVVRLFFFFFSSSQLGFLSNQLEGGGRMEEEVVIK